MAAASNKIFDLAVATIFAREFMEAAIVIGEFRTIILRGDSLEPGLQKEVALREVTKSSVFAILFALVVIAAVAIPLAVLSHQFNSTTSNIIEGVSKVIASVCILQLSLKIPRFLGIYKGKKPAASTKSGTNIITNTSEEEEEDSTDKLGLKAIRFNIVWNVWREVAECGVFLIPFFLSNDNLLEVPLSAVIGTTLGLLCGLGIYFANNSFKDKNGLAIFTSLLLVFLSAGLFCGGCHEFEEVTHHTPYVWKIPGTFWSVNRLPMTILKPFGYSDTRTVLQFLCFWLWLLLAAVLHYRRRAFEIRRRLEEAGVNDCPVDPTLKAVSFDNETPAMEEEICSDSTTQITIDQDVEVGYK